MPRHEMYGSNRMAVGCCVVLLLVMGYEMVQSHISLEHLEKIYPRSSPRRPPTGRSLRNEGLHAASHPVTVKKEFKHHQVVDTKHAPLHQPEGKRPKVFFIQERDPKLPRAKSVHINDPNKCHYHLDGKWDSSKRLEFLCDSEGSGLFVDQMRQALGDAYATWKDVSSAVPDAKFIDVTDLTPSSHKKLRVPNDVNEISFEYGQHATIGVAHIIAEIYLWQKPSPDGKGVINTEMDVIFKRDEHVGWCVHEKQPGNPNHWYNDKQNRFDLTSAAIQAFGHILGLGHSKDHTQTMHGLSMRDDCCKRSLECGDVKGILELYPPPSATAVAAARDAQSVVVNTYK